MPPLPCIRFRHRTVIEMTPLVDLLTGTERTLKIRELKQKTDRVFVDQERQRAQDKAEAECAFQARVQPGPVATTTHPLGDFGYRAGWYGVEQNRPVCVRQIVPERSRCRLEFSEEFAALVGTSDYEPCQHPSGPVAIPTPLEDGSLSAELLDPIRCLFRHPGEIGFWNEIVADCLDITARVIYADWLDDHEDAHGWVFREPWPFRLGNLKLDWVGAVGRVDCGPVERRRLWQFTRITGRGSAIPLSLSDGTPIPQFIAYLIGVTRIRTEHRLTSDERGLISDQTRMLGLNLMADMIVGPDDEPICRVTDILRTIYFLGEMMGHDEVTLRDLIGPLREINHPG